MRDPSKTSELLDSNELLLPQPTSSVILRALAGRLYLVVYFRDGTSAHNLVEEQPVVIGRAPDADMVIPEPSLSRHHARVTLQADTVLVEDLDSTYGVIVDGKKVKQGVLQPGQEMRLGSVIVAVHRHTGVVAQWPRFEKHERFMLLLKDDVIRAEAFGRKLGVLMLTAPEGKDREFRRYCASVPDRLSAVERIAFYSPDLVEIALPETDAERITALAQSLVAKKIEVTVFCAAVMFPEGGRSADELMANCKSLLRQTSLAMPMQFMQSAVSHRPSAQRGAVAGSVTRVMEPTRPPVVASATMQAVYQQIKRIADSDVSVLITGETGTGKEVAARAIHRQSRRGNYEMRYVNCGAIPPSLIESVLFGHEKGAFTGASDRAIGVFEAAHGSTLLLDELAELSPQSQVALLRVLETHQLTRVGGTKVIDVDVRVLAATNRNLEDLVATGVFRADLLFRLNTLTLHLPPLRDRRDEIEPMVYAFIEQVSRTQNRKVESIDPAALQLLQQYHWPGNVRELRNVIDRSVILAQQDVIDVVDLPDHIRALQTPATMENANVPDLTASASHSEIRDYQIAKSISSKLDFKARIAQVEAQLILDALREANWNQTEAARRLRIPFRTMTYKMQTYGIRRAGFEIDE